MAKYKLVVMSDAFEGREDEYNDWYNNIHLADVVDVPGFTSAQRFEPVQVVLGGFQNKYMAIYEIEADDPQPVIDAMMARRGTEQMEISDSLDVEGCTCVLFKEASPEVSSGVSAPASLGVTHAPA